MSWALPRLLRRVGAALVHTQYAVPLRCPCPAVVTVHDVSFERDPTLMRSRDRAVFRRVVPRAVRRACARSHRLAALAGRPRRAYGVHPSASWSPRTASTPPSTPARPRSTGTCSRWERSSRARTCSPPWPRLARWVSRSSSSARPETQGSPRSCGAAARGSRAMSRSSGWPSSTAAPRASCRRPATRASGCRCSRRWRAGRPSSPSASRRFSRSWAMRPWSSSRGELADGIRRALAERDRLAWAGLERARAFSWRATAEATVRGVPRGVRAMSVSAVVVSHGHAAEVEQLLPALVPQVDECVVVANLPGSAATRRRGRARDREPAAVSLRREHEPRHRRDDGRVRARA